VNLHAVLHSSGQRKYLTPAERKEFLPASEPALHFVRTFCGTPTHTGCRISEVLALSTDRVDIEGGLLIVESLKKKRRKGVLPRDPSPACLPRNTLMRFTIFAPSACGMGVYLWPWSRPTAWRRFCGVVEAAGKWLGHANRATTAIYTDATGSEENQRANKDVGLMPRGMSEPRRAMRAAPPERDSDHECHSRHLP
jgi:integrase